ncbi:hypothetical protein ACNQGO_03760 [Flavobacterium sp. ZT3P35]|uniref:hypothetical protein n=1 Tax=Flavobacterium sp. ZT3P35 TaxID=3401727 RepID=UPI003AAEA756
MKFIDLFEIAVKLGFKAIPVKDEYYKIAFKSSNSLNIEISFPNDTINEESEDSINIDWGYSIRNDHNIEIHNEWFDYYKGNSKTKIEDMQNDISEYLNNFANSKFSIIEKSVFSIFGIRFLKYKKLVFEKNHNESYTT